MNKINKYPCSLILSLHTFLVFIASSLYLCDKTTFSLIIFTDFFIFIFFPVVATNPMEIVKIRMQMQALLPVAERQNTMQVIKGLGLKGLYQGTAATLSRDVPFSVLFFPGYANIKAMMADKDGNNSMISNLVAGVAAGALASGAVTPSDVIKTR